VAATSDTRAAGVKQLQYLMADPSLPLPLLPSGDEPLVEKPWW